MNVLMIGGTGTISMAITSALLEAGHEVFLLNRGHRHLSSTRKNLHQLQADIDDQVTVKSLLKGYHFDAVVNFIVFTPDQIDRDFHLFRQITNQYIFISSATVYQKPPDNYLITENTPLHNPFWTYAQAKITCEQRLMELYTQDGFPATIVRPSHTYDNRSIPLGVYGHNGSWQVAQRMLAHKPVIIHGDGTSLWTMTNHLDFARGFIGLVGHLPAIGEAYHITSDETLSWNQIYDHIAQALAVELKAVHIASEFLAAKAPYDFRGSLLGDKAHSVVFDNAKIKLVVPTFRPEISFRDGIRTTVEHILRHPELQPQDEAFDTWCDRCIKSYNR